MVTIRRFFNKFKGSYFLFGPRGTGKTTWLKANHPEGLIIDLLEPDIYRYYSARPERIRGIIEANPKKELIIIDEIQKVTPLLDPIHWLIMCLFSINGLKGQ